MKIPRFVPFAGIATVFALAVCTLFFPTRSDAQPPEPTYPKIEAAIRSGQVSPAEAWKEKTLTAHGVLHLLETDTGLRDDIRKSLVAVLADNAYDVLLPPDGTKPQMPDKIRYEAALYLQGKRDARVFPILKAMLAEASKTGGGAAVSRLGRAYRDLGRHQEAGDTFASAPDYILPKYRSWRASSLIDAARQYEIAGDHKKAMAAWMRIPEFDSGWENGFLMRKLADDKFAEGDIEAGRDFLRQKITGLDALDAQIYSDNFLTKSYLETNETAAAIEAAERALTTFEGIKDLHDEGRQLKSAGQTAQTQLKRAQYQKLFAEPGLGLNAKGIWIQPYWYHGITRFVGANLRDEPVTLHFTVWSNLGEKLFESKWELAPGEVNKELTLNQAAPVMSRFLRISDENGVELGRMRLDSGWHRLQTEPLTYRQNLNGRDGVNRGWYLVRYSMTLSGKDAFFHFKIPSHSGVLTIPFQDPTTPQKHDLPFLPIISATCSSLKVEKTADGWRIDTDAPLKKESIHTVVLSVHCPDFKTVKMMRMEMRLDNATGEIPIVRGIAIGPYVQAATAISH